jgi:hypothetical protein
MNIKPRVSYDGKTSVQWSTIPSSPGPPGKTNLPEWDYGVVPLASRAIRAMF